MGGTDVSMFESVRPLIISTKALYKKKEVGLPPPQEKLLRRLGRTDKVDWDDVKREYIKKVVPKKMTLRVLAKIFSISTEHLRRKRIAENWPERKNLICDEEKCSNVSCIKEKCKKCYQRNYMRKRAAILKKKRAQLKMF